MRQVAIHQIFVHGSKGVKRSGQLSLTDTGTELEWGSTYGKGCQSRQYSHTKRSRIRSKLQSDRTRLLGTQKFNLSLATMPRILIFCYGLRA